ncbi:hypothetical protein FB45DRAFT_874052 [Roridomyces roridus]|uniref:Fungal-type protein kinase domain-containing protein n=1 Tax=Roridomyces roridus TaxID=1738132 RepID=A0AAD7B9X2_9AGAR|nr:hypothetical protein FB45DRAFT_874052 [Roridomyces roridus]
MPYAGVYTIIPAPARNKPVWPDKPNCPAKRERNSPRCPIGSKENQSSAAGVAPNPELNWNTAVLSVSDHRRGPASARVTPHSSDCRLTKFIQTRTSGNFINFQDAKWERAWGLRPYCNRERSIKFTRLANAAESYPTAVLTGRTPERWRGARAGLILSSANPQNSNLKVTKRVPRSVGNVFHHPICLPKDEHRYRPQPYDGRPYTGTYPYPSGLWDLDLTGRNCAFGGHTGLEQSRTEKSQLPLNHFKPTGQVTSPSCRPLTGDGRVFYRPVPVGPRISGGNGRLFDGPHPSRPAKLTAVTRRRTVHIPTLNLRPVDAFKLKRSSVMVPWPDLDDDRDAENNRKISTQLGYRWLYEILGIMHRDISLFNLMFRIKDSKFPGVFNNFRLAVYWKDTAGSTANGRTGTDVFMASELVHLSPVKQRNSSNLCLYSSHSVAEPVNYSTEKKKVQTAPPIRTQESAANRRKTLPFEQQVGSPLNLN